MTAHPELLDLFSWPNLDFTEPDFPKKLWRVPTPKECELEFTIIMSFLAFPSRPTEEKLFKRLNMFLKTDDEAESPNRYNQIKKYFIVHNPFKNNKRQIFPNDLQKLIVAAFKNELKPHLEIENKNSENETYILLRAASKMLRCTILYYKTDIENSNSFCSFEVNDEFTEDNPQKLYIFQNIFVPTSDHLKSLFAYGLSEEDAFFWRRDALKYILKTARIPNDFMKEILMEPLQDRNFLIHLLQSNLDSSKDILKRIFEFPYIALKLSEAGFNTDPLEVGENNCSIFYYSLGLSDTKLFQLLYNYAANYLQFSESSTRKPTDDMLLRLEKIKIALCHDCSESRHFSRLGDELYEQFMRFNEFQIEIVRKIISIRNRESEYNIQQQKIILGALKIYCNFFYFNVTGQNNNERMFEDYIIYHEYYEMLDSFICLLFFDSFNSLETRINVNNQNIYTNCVSSLLLLIFSHKRFPHTDNIISDEVDVETRVLNNIDEETHTINTNFLRYIPFSYRLSFKQNALNLIIELENSLSTTCEPLDVIRNSLANLPEILNGFIKNRIDVYMETASSTEEMTRKNALIIERTLQVVGEVVQNETVSDCASKYFLCSCLPNELQKTFRSIRNECFAKYRANSIQGRINFERNFPFLKNIQEELQCIYENFVIIASSQLNEIEIMMLNQGMNTSSTNCNSVLNKLQEVHKKVINEKNIQFITNKNTFTKFITNLLAYVSNSINDSKQLTYQNIKNEVMAIYFMLSYISEYTGGFQSNTFKDLASNIKQCLDQMKALETQKKKSKEKKGIENNKKEEEEREVKMSLLITSLYRLLCDSMTNIFKIKTVSFDFYPEFNYLKTLLHSFKKETVFDLKEEYIIRKQINNLLLSSKHARQYCLDRTQSSTSTNFKEKLSKIVMTEKDRKYINDNIISNPEKAFTCLNNIHDFDVIQDNESLVSRIQSMTEKSELRTLLSKMHFDSRLKKKVYRIIKQKIDFLIDRINRLKEIIFEDDFVKLLYKRGKSEKVKMHAKLLICQRYMAERETRFALEMLLFDCFNILNSEELIILWKKSTNILSGINLRDILAHGNPILEIVSALLDENDLPLSILKAIIMLIEDRESLAALSALWYKIKTLKFKDFIAYVKFAGLDHNIELRKTIQTSPRWQKYVELLPMEK